MPKTLKIKQNEGGILKQASRFKPCPPKLAELIELVNMIPPEADLPAITKVWSELWTNLKQSITEEGDDEDLAVISDLWLDVEQSIVTRIGTKEYHESIYGEDLQSIKVAIAKISHTLEGLPEAFRAYIWQDKKQINTCGILYAIDDAIRRYAFVRDSREKLKGIIELTRAGRHKQESLTYRSPFLTTYTEIGIDDQGLIKIQKDRFTEAVEGVEAARIRECEACKRIFWAGRKTQKGCSARCGDIIRKRRHRERYRQGFYQGAKLTDKEKAALKIQQKQHKAKKGK